MNRQNVIQKFIWGMTSLSSYIYFNNKINLYDINILSENSFRDLLNIIKDWKMRNTNLINYNNPGFDLIDEENKILIQITSTDSPQKIKDTWNTMSWRYQPSQSNNGSADDSNIDLSGYAFFFIILKNYAENIKKYCKKHGSGNGCPYFLFFDAQKNVLDLGDLVTIVNDLDIQHLHRLEAFMLGDTKLFSRIDFRENQGKVSEIIKEYADNYTTRMFLHTYRPESKITLENVYVQPKYCTPGSTDYSRDMISLISRFICENPSECILYIDGDAAVGKTSLVSWLCYQYSRQDKEDNYFSLRKALFLDKQLVCIRLRELDFRDNLRKPIEIVLSYLKISDMREFQRRYDDALIVLDGIDEISMVDNVKPHFLSGFINDIRKAFKNNKLIITGRPYFFDVEELRSEQYSIRHIELLHFDHDMRREWMDKYEACGETIPVSTKDYILSLEDENAAGVADTPLALYMLVSCEVRDELCGNRWALFHEIFRNAIIKTEYNENFSNSSTHPVSEIAEDIYRAVCLISHNMFMNSSQERYYITGDELEIIVSNMDDVTIPNKQFRKCCVLCAYWKSNLKYGALEFYHNDIRDFFFCEYIYEVLNNRIKETSSKTFIFDFITDMCSIFRYGSICSTTWEQTFEFLYLKLLSESKHHQEAANNIINTICARYSELVGRLLGGSELFQQQFNDINYTLVKQITINTLLLLNTVAEAGFQMKGTRQTLSFSPDEKSRTQIISSDILNNWCEMFLKDIRISENKYIQFGNYLDLSAIEFRYVDLSRSDFSYSDLSGTKFDHVNLRNVSFSHASLNGTVFSGCNLSDADFRSAVLENVIFKDCIFINTNFYDARIDNCGFSTEKSFTGSFENAELTACQMAHLEFEDTVFLRSDFIQVDLKGTDFSAVNEMENTNFLHCNLNGSVFNDMNLRVVSFDQTTLHNAHFNSTKFDSCFMEKAKLSNTDFSGANFSQTTINRERMYLCNTNEAVFDGVSFHNLKF